MSFRGYYGIQKSILICQRLTKKVFVTCRFKKSILSTVLLILLTKLFVTRRCFPQMRSPKCNRCLWKKYDHSPSWSSSVYVPGDVAGSLAQDQKGTPSPSFAFFPGGSARQLRPEPSISARSSRGPEPEDSVEPPPSANRRVTEISDYYEKDWSKRSLDSVCDMD